MFTVHYYSRSAHTKTQTITPLSPLWWQSTFRVWLDWQSLFCATVSVLFNTETRGRLLVTGSWFITQTRESRPKHQSGALGGGFNVVQICWFSFSSLLRRSRVESEHGKSMSSQSLISISTWVCFLSGLGSWLLVVFLDDYHWLDESVIRLRRCCCDDTYGSWSCLGVRRD